MGNLAEVYGDLFELDFPAIGHGCNCVGVMGAGIAKEFRSRWPDMYLEYKDFCEDGSAFPGDFYPYELPGGLMVYNMLTQPVPGPSAQIKYIEMAVTKSIADCIERGIDVLAIPRIGAGLGGLRWSDIRFRLGDLVKWMAPGFTLVVVSLPPAEGQPHPDVEHLSLFPHPFIKVKEWKESSSGKGTVAAAIEYTSDIDEADLIISRVSKDSILHTIMLDLDVPAVLVPSTTPGHSHLYIDVPLTWGSYRTLLDALAACKVLEKGFAEASKKRGFTALRLPWIKKTPVK